MISIIEQGFFRRNWGKLALGGGALAFAASRGEEMPVAGLDAAKTTVKNTVTPNIHNMVDQLKARGSNVGKFIGGKLQPQNLDNTVQNTAQKTGELTQKVVDYGKKTGQSFQQGYQGPPKPNVPNIPPHPNNVSNSGAGMFWNKAFRNQRPNVPGYAPV